MLKWLMSFPLPTFLNEWKRKENVIGHRREKMRTTASTIGRIVNFEDVGERGDSKTRSILNEPNHLISHH